MKVSLEFLISQAIRAYKTYQEAREVIQRESPESLADFDARVASARVPMQQAADAGAAENAAAKADNDDDMDGD